MISLFPLPSASMENSRISLEKIPPLEQLERVVLKRAGLDPRQIQTWQKRARWSAALPRFQVGWENKFINQNTTIIQDSISVTSNGVTLGPESNRINTDLSNNQDFELKAVWSLDELLFNRNQLDISREARDLLITRQRLLGELHQSYYRLKSHLLQMQSKPASLKNPLEQLKLDQLVDKLNSLSGGEFKRLIYEPSSINHLTKGRP